IRSYCSFGNAGTKEKQSKLVDIAQIISFNLIIHAKSEVFMTSFESFSGAVLTHSTLLSLLEGYKAPNYKIHTLLKEGRLIGLKKGLYAVAPVEKNQLISLPLVANHLYGPSYVSLEFALYHYGVIPEYVADITSVCTKRGKMYDTPLGRFTYQQLPSEYY